MKKVLLSIGAMIVLLQFSNAAQASQGRYIIQDKPVTFFTTNSIDNSTVEDKKEVQEVKSTPETNVQEENVIKETPVVKKETPAKTEEDNVKNIQQKQPLVEEKPVVEEEKPVIEEENQPAVEEKTEEPTGEEKQPVEDEQKVIDENQQSEIDQTQEPDNADEQEISSDETQVDKNFVILKDVKLKDIVQEKVEPATPEVVAKFKTVFDKNLDNASVIVDNSDIISLKGLFMMYKSIFGESEQAKKYEETVSELETTPNSPEKAASILQLKKVIIFDDLCPKMENFDFASLSQERKYMWGQGTYILQIGQNRTENVAIDIAPYYQLIANGKINPKDVKSQLEKSSALTLRIKDTLEIQGAAVGLASRINEENQIKVTIPENEMARQYKVGLIVPYQDQLWEIHEAGTTYENNVISHLGDLVVQPQENSEENSKFVAIKATLLSIQKSLESDPAFKLNADQKEMIKALPIDTTILSNMYLKFSKEANKFKSKISRDKLLKNTVIMEYDTIQNLMKDATMQEQYLKDINAISKKIQQMIK